MPTWVRFERGRDSVVGPTFGPYPFVQLTYEELRIGPNGETLAVLHPHGDWYVTAADPKSDSREWSDAIIYDAEKSE